MKQLSDEERAEKILAAMNRLKRRKEMPRLITWFPWILTAALIVAIAFVILSNRQQFLQIWNHLVRPDSLPGM